MMSNPTAEQLSEWAAASAERLSRPHAGFAAGDAVVFELRGDRFQAIVEDVGEGFAGPTYLVRFTLGGRAMTMWANTSEVS